MQIADVPNGGEQGAVFLIDYSEDLWLSFNDDDKKFCYGQWTRKAKPIPDVKYVVLRLHPDPLFPMHGNEKPYTAWQITLDKPVHDGFTIDVAVTVTIPRYTKFIDPIVRAQISRALEGAAQQGTPWRIINSGGQVLEHGTL